MNHTEDIKELIRREIQTIESLEERVAFKRLMEQVFLAVYETNEQMYLNLEKRVQEELDFDANRYLIKTGVIERAYFDVSHHLMVPIEEEDLEIRQYSMKDIVDTVEAEGAFSIMKVMLQCDCIQMQKIWNESLEFDGTIETDKPEETWNITVKLQQNVEYLKKLGHLYQLFIKNGIPWQTVNAPYLYRMADVVLTKLPEGIKGNEIIKKVQINFGKFKQIICHDLVPIWNIQKLELDSIGFPVPCEDHKNYEHIISFREHGMEHAYLAEDDSQIQSISQRNEKLLIVSGISDVKKWNIYMIKNSQDSKIDHYTYPVMQNVRADSFSEKFQKKWNQSIKTRVELSRFIKGFCLEDYVIYQDCEILNQFQDKNQTYSMNPFIEDEIRDTRAQKKLLLSFKAGTRETWLQRDVASFIVAEVQRIYPEYECGGILV